jgi:GntR family transcriptional regulator
VTRTREPSGAARPDARPLSERTRDALLAAIRAGAFEGGRLPPEVELAERLGVSRTTLRAALQSLSADGLISRRRRDGTFVNGHLLRTSMRLNRLVAFTELIEGCGHAPSVDPQLERVEPLSARDADALGVEPGAPCLVVERLLRAGGAPVITVVDVVPVGRLRRGPSEVRQADSTFAFLADNGAAPVDYATSEFIPRVATESEPRGLELEPGEPYIELLETHYSRVHERIALSWIAVDDSLVRLSMLRRAL